MASNPRRAAVPLRGILGQARQLADLGDQWLVSVGESLGRIGGWAQGEADAAAELAIGATCDTVSTARDRASTPRSGARRPEGAATPAAEPSTGHPAAPSAPDPDPGAGSTDELSGLRPGYELLVAAPTEPEPSEAVEPRRNAAGAVAGAPPSHPPGVLPVVQALGRVVADHSERGFTTLPDDERLWPLVDLLDSLTGPRQPDPILPDIPDPASVPPLSGHATRETKTHGSPQPKVEEADG